MGKPFVYSTRTLRSEARTRKDIAVRETEKSCTVFRQSDFIGRKGLAGNRVGTHAYIDHARALTDATSSYRYRSYYIMITRRPYDISK